jgi:hypothetical protein
VNQTATSGSESRWDSPALISLVRKNETTNFAMTTKTKTKMKTRALIGPDAIRPALNAIDGFPPEPDVIDASQQAQIVIGAFRPVQNVVDAIELELNRPVAERELPDSDAVVEPLRSNFRRHDLSFPDCAGIAPGQKVWAESVEPTTSIAPVTAVGNSQAPNHIPALQAAKNDIAYPDCKLMPAVLENSSDCDHPIDWQPLANCDFAQSQPANSTAQPALYFADSKSQVSQGALSRPRRVSSPAPQALSPARRV